MKFKVRGVDKLPYIIDRRMIKRFSYRNTVLARIDWFSSWESYGKKLDERALKRMEEGSLATLELTLHFRMRHEFYMMRSQVHLQGVRLSCIEFHPPQLELI